MQCQEKSKKKGGMLSYLNQAFFGPPAPPIINPDAADDLALGELPPARRDYRKMYDPLKEPTRRYTHYPTGGPVGGVFNVPTQGLYPSYQVMGFLTKQGDPDRMLKLYGRRIDRYRYEYYTSHHDDPELKIPLKNKGDNELMQGENVKVPGFDGNYTVNVYEMEAPKYVPFVY